MRSRGGGALLSQLGRSSGKGRYYTMRYDTIRYDTILYGGRGCARALQSPLEMSSGKRRMVRYYMIRYDTIRYDTTWYGRWRCARALQSPLGRSSVAPVELSQGMQTVPSSDAAAWRATQLVQAE